MFIAMFTTSANGFYPEPDEFSLHSRYIFPKINFSIIFPSVSRFYGGLFPSEFPAKICTHFLTHMRAMCSSHIIILDLIILVMSGEKYECILWGLFVCSFLQSAVTSPETMLVCVLPSRWHTGSTDLMLLTVVKSDNVSPDDFLRLSRFFYSK
jgi:hypothetical protein